MHSGSHIRSFANGACRALDKPLMHNTDLKLSATISVDSPLSCTVDVTPAYVISSGVGVNGSVTGHDSTMFGYAGDTYGAGLNEVEEFDFKDLTNNQGYQVAYWFDCTSKSC